MTNAFTDDLQIEEFSHFDFVEEMNEFLAEQDDQEDLDDYYSQHDDDAALEYYSLCCAYGEEY